MRTPASLSNCITIGNFFCGTLSLYFSAQGQPLIAAYIILGSMILDFLDGRIARLTHTVSELGKQLDSLADLVAFGIAPMILVCSVFYKVQGSGGWLPGFLYAGCGMFRLAKYNIQTKEEKKSYFMGLPIPAAAGFVTTAIITYMYLDIKFILVILIPIAMILAAFLMVSKVRYPNFNWVDSRKIPVILFIILGFAILVFFKYSYLLLLAVFVGYVLGGLFPQLMEKIQSLLGKPAQSHT